MKLLIQPRDGIAPVIAAIKRARKSIEVVIFRFDRDDIERALQAAVARGVQVHALIAHTNQGGAGRLRKLEQRLLGAGATVDRTGDDFVRYHGKFMIVDRSTLLVLGFNYTLLDILKSRSFGIVTKDRRAVTEALRLFESDTLRQEYEPQEEGSFVVSPENAREILATFIKRAKKQLLIYDPKVADLQMIRLINQRIKAGVDVRIIGKVAKRGGAMRVQKMPGHRLHVRAMVRDGDTAFVGSQSLRAMELDARREIGVIVKEPKTVREMAEVFEGDWAKTDLGAKEAKEAKKEEKEAKKEEKEKEKERELQTA
jgi:phosphatidylserine/phosphatidylglycerophosphate/cardiolipin synthase-like enzyme